MSWNPNFNSAKPFEPPFPTKDMHENTYADSNHPKILGRCAAIKVLPTFHQYLMRPVRNTCWFFQGTCFISPLHLVLQHLHRCCSTIGYSMMHSLFNIYCKGCSSLIQSISKLIKGYIYGAQTLKKVKMKNRRIMTSIQNYSRVYKILHTKQTGPSSPFDFKRFQEKTTSGKGTYIQVQRPQALMVHKVSL